MKQVKKRLAIVNIFMKNQMQDKTNLVLDSVNMITRCFIVFLLYKYIFNLKGGTINGENYSTTMWSMFIYFCIMTLRLRVIYNYIMEDVKSGNVEMYLNRPIDYLKYSYYRSIGRGLYSFIIISVVGSIIMLLTLGFPSVNLKVFIPTFIITFMLGQILSLLMYGIIGLLSFFIQDVRPVYWIADKLVMVLGGSYLPISLFPKLLKIFAYISPFGAINFATSTVFSSWNQDYLIRIAVQVIWILVFILLSRLVYRKARKKAMINGG